MIGKLYSHRLCILILAIAFLALPGPEEACADEDEVLTSGEINALIQRILEESESEVIATQGREVFDQVKRRIGVKFPRADYPSPATPFAPDPFTCTKDVSTGMTRTVINGQSGAYFIAGLEALCQRAPDIARWCFAKAASMAYMNPVYLCNLASLLNWSGHLEDGVKLLEFAKRLDPEYSSVYVNLGFSYFNLQEYSAASENYLMATMMNPMVPEYQQGLIDSLKKTAAETMAGTSDRQDIAEFQESQLDRALEILGEESDRNRSDSPRRDFGAGDFDPRERDFGYEERGVPVDLDIVEPIEGVEYWAMTTGRETVNKMFNDAEAGIRMMENTAKWHYQEGNDFGFLTWTMTADLFRMLMYDKGDRLIESELLPYLEDMAARIESARRHPPGDGSENFDQVWFGPFSLSTGDQGTYKLELSLPGFIGIEPRINVENINLGGKVSFGPNVKLGLGNASTQGGAEVYFEADFNDLAMGAEIKGNVAVFDQQIIQESQTITRWSCENGWSSEGWSPGG
jgi:tetratricopeptide (TPR) repeat protein